MAEWDGQDSDSDQLFYTKIFLNPEKRVRGVGWAGRGVRGILTLGPVGQAALGTALWDLSKWVGVSVHLDCCDKLP